MIHAFTVFLILSNQLLWVGGFLRQFSLSNPYAL